MRGTLLVAAMLLLPVAPAYGGDLKIAEAVNRFGDPGLAAATWPGDGGTLEWRRCAEGGTVCEPLPDSAYVQTVQNGRIAYPGDTPAGTVFEAVATKDGVETKARTRSWQGRVTSTVAPVLQGEAAVGKTVTSAQGAWAGGWGPGPGVSISDTIFACNDASGRDCWLISYGPTVTPDPRWAGWYLFAQESLYAGDATCNAVLSCFVSASYAVLPAHIGPQRGATFALSAPLGPIAPVPTAAPRMPRAPSAAVRARALRSKGKLLVGRVSCEARCSVQLKVSGGHRRAVHKTLTVTGAKALTVPVRHGKLKVRVVVDGKQLATGTTRAR